MRSKKEIWILAAGLAAALAWLALGYAASLNAGQGLKPASVLDDAYIYFQYAHEMARGHFFSYQEGAAASSGVTGLLYLLILSLLSRLGFEGPLAAWFIGTASLLGSLALLPSLAKRCFPKLGEDWGAALFFSLGPLLACYFNGMETGLFCFLLLASLDAFLEEPLPGRAWVLLSLLALSRPEGQLAAAMLASRELIFKRQNWKGPALALGAAALPSVLDLALTGSLVPDSVRAKALSFASDPLQVHIIGSSEYFVGALKGLFSGFFGDADSVGFAGIKSQGNTPSMLYAPLALPLALWGIFASQARLSRALKPWLLWALACLILQSWKIPVGWHQFRYLALDAPLIWLGAALALERLKSLGSEGALATALALWLSFGAASLAWHAAQSYDSTLRYRAFNGAAAAWLKSHAAPEEAVLVVDSGILAWESGHKIVDLPGITDHQLSLAAQATELSGSGPVFKELMRRPPEQRPLWAVLAWGRQDFDPSHWAQAGLLKEEARLEGPGGGQVGIFRVDQKKLASFAGAQVP
jgi:hypothetical protein